MLEVNVFDQNVDYSNTLEDEPYATSAEHLWDELRRIDLLVRAQTVRWRLTLGSSKPEHLWGMVHVTDAEVEAYLESEYLPPAELPPALAQALADHWEASSALEKSICRRRERTPPERELRLDRLRKLFNLSDLERDLILVCLLVELDGRYRRLFGYLQDDASRTQPTVELALQILQPQARRMVDASLQADSNQGELALAAARAALDPGGPLLTHSLMVIGGEARGDEALPMRSLRLDDRIADYLLGRDTNDGRLVGVAFRSDTLLDWDEIIASKDQVAHLQALAAWMRKLHGAEQQEPVLLLRGPYGSGRHKAAQALCTTVGLHLIIAHAPAAINSPHGWERIVNLVYREATLSGAAVLWTDCDSLLERRPERENEPHSARWESLIAAAERFPGLTLFSSEVAWDPSLRFRDRPFLTLEFPVPNFSLRAKLWERHLPPPESFAAPAPDRGALSRELANDFQFTEGQVLDALATARGEALQRNPLAPRLSAVDLYEGCRRQSGRSLVTFARRIEPRTELTFDDLILPLANKRQLEELSVRIQYRNMVYSDLGYERRLSLGKGLIALFTGTSGTGKTMAAELLARQRGVDLYKVDLSAVSSKWVGETEKNLARVFEEAEDANAIIFFDEADALFGKRGEVKEAQDRWANMEVNYLLQRVEEYAGVVILASNLRQNIDDAFLRRIQWMVDFPFPDAEARFRIYRRVFPDTVRYPGDARLRDLAERFRLTGGSIKNVVVDATFRALAGYDPESGRPPYIHVSHLVLAIAREYQKLSMPISRGEFGETYYSYVECKILAPRPNE